MYLHRHVFVLNSSVGSLHRNSVYMLNDYVQNDLIGVEIYISINYSGRAITSASQSQLSLEMFMCIIPVLETR